MMAAMPCCADGGPAMRAQMSVKTSPDATLVNTISMVSASAAMSSAAPVASIAAVSLIDVDAHTPPIFLRDAQLRI